MKERREKIGRPKLGEAKRRFRIYASFTNDEKLRILKKAQDANISPSDFLYRAALGRQISPPHPQVNLDALREINAIGRNLNLLLRGIYNYHQIEPTTIEKYFAILSELKSQIIGKE